jgi:hypothetical protein
MFSFCAFGWRAKMVRAQSNLFLWPPGYALCMASPYRQSSSPLHPLPSTLFLFILFYKEENHFSLEFSQSYQGARLNFKKTENRDEYFNHLLLYIIRYQITTL